MDTVIKLALSLLVVVLLPVLVSGNEPENAISCLHRNAEFEYACRQNFALGYRCFNSEACAFDSTDLKETTFISPNNGDIINGFTCSDTDYARRVGMLCTHFPWYQGSYPMSSLYKYEIWENYNCNTTTTAGLSTYCSEWQAVEDGSMEYSNSDYECNTESSVGSYRYCSEWTGTKKVSKKCPSNAASCTPNCEQPTYCEVECCNDDDCSDCSFDTFYGYRYTTGSCISVNEYGVCTYWKQEEYGPNSRTVRDYEEFTCREHSVSGLFCKQFVGNIDSKIRFELSSCECVDRDVDSSSKTHCSEWKCFNVQVKYWFTNFIWILLVVGPVLFFQGGFFYSHFFEDDVNHVYEESRDLHRYVCFINICLLVVILWHAGVTVAIISLFCATLPGYFGGMYISCKQEDEDMNNWEIFDRSLAALVGLHRCADAPIFFHFFCGCLCQLCEIHPDVDEANRQERLAAREAGDEMREQQENQERKDKQLELIEKELGKHKNRKGVPMKMGSNGLLYCGKYVGEEGFSDQGIHNSSLYCGPDSGPQCRDCTAGEDDSEEDKDIYPKLRTYGLVPHHAGEDVI